MQLKEKLKENTKQELLDHARSLEIRGYSGLRKEQLIDKIVSHLCSEGILRSRLACLTKEQMNLYRRACISPMAVDINEVADAMQLYRYWLGNFEEPTDNFYVYNDIAQAFQTIDDEAFQWENHKKGWMMKCIHFFIEYYGIAPLEVIYKLYNQKVKCSLDEMIVLLKEIPMDITESCILSVEQSGIIYLSEDSPLYSKKGFLIHISLCDMNELEYLLTEQAGKKFFVPSEQIIDEIYRNEYEVSAPAYKKLESFFRKKMKLPYDLAVTYCLQIWASCYEGNSPMDIMNIMSEEGVIFNSEKDINEFVGLLMNANNSTRLKENRGNKPDEIRNDILKVGMPTIVAESSNAATLLKKAEPQLHAIGFPIDIDGGADTIQSLYYPEGLNHRVVTTEKKIYPNDPCLCGSGKKYKKCCGKFKQI